MKRAELYASGARGRRSRLACLALGALGLGAPGCNGFDPELYRAAERSAKALDSCIEADVPVVESNTEFVALDLSDLDDSWQVANCAQDRADGNDAFFAVDMKLGQKFHFHINAIDPIDPVLYVVDSCDERVCQPLNAASSCGSDKEHLSFLATRAGRYYVGIDSTDPGGGKVEVLAISPVCGDGEKQHSESCDDGNSESGDGCDERCRIEIPASERKEQEPNDDLAGGNVLELPEAPARFSIHGTLAGPCDPETFTFRVASDTRLRARVLDAAGGTCGPSDNPELKLDLQLFEGLTAVAQGKQAEDSACPVLPEHDLRGTDSAAALPWERTTYHLQLRGKGSQVAGPIEYTLELELEER